jgi:hypothetical protein
VAGGIASVRNGSIVFIGTDFAPQVVFGSGTHAQQDGSDALFGSTADAAVELAKR